MHARGIACDAAKEQQRVGVGALQAVRSLLLGLVCVAISLRVWFTLVSFGLTSELLGGSG